VPAEELDEAHLKARALIAAIRMKA
jgi:anthranilate/para-aminobenzoate synthase component I